MLIRSAGGSFRACQDRSLALCILIFITVLVCSDPASAQVLVYEGFDIAAGTSGLDNSAGGTSQGWTPSSAWSPSGKDIVVPSMAYIDTTGISLRTAGNRVATDTLVDSFRTLPATINSGTVWISLIARATAPSSSGYLGIVLQSGATNQFFVGERFLSNRWSIERSSIAGQEADSDIVANVASFLVARIDFNQGTTPGNENAYLWVNPDLDFPPSVAQASATLMNFQSIDFNRVAVQGGYMTGGNELDEIRIGSTFADVAPSDVVFRDGFESRLF